VAWTRHDAGTVPDAAATAALVTTVFGSVSAVRLSHEPGVVVCAADAGL
jgi:hypothetical protein